MKSKILGLVLALSVCGNVYADVCSDNLVKAHIFSAATAQAFCAIFQYEPSGFEVVAGAGSTVGDAAALSATKGIHQITGANGTLGWKFSASTPIGSAQTLLNTTAGVAKIYAESGGTVNGGSVDAAFSALTGVKSIICYKTAALTYICS